MMKKRFESKLNRIAGAAGLVMAASEVWKQLSLTYLVGEPGSYILWYLPFQLCSIPMYLCLLLLFTRSGKLTDLCSEFLCTFGLMAGIAAFFDTSGFRYDYPPLTVHSFAWHIGMILLGIYAGIDRILCGRGFRFASFTGAAGIYLVCCAAAEALNLALDRFGIINMFYINPHYRMEQVVFSRIAERIGNSPGILAYILCSMLGALLLHLLWKCFGRQER